MNHLPTDLLSPIFLYAETHFRFFKAFPSFLYKKDPEIIFDCPKRLNPGSDLPILLLINDIKQTSPTINEVSVSISGPSFPIRRFNFSNISVYEIKHPFDQIQKAYLFYFNRNQLPDGNIFINCMAKGTNNKHAIEVLNDNLQTTSKAPYTCIVSKDFLPGTNLCFYGDMHYHSHYSQSHVEFGPPLIAVDKIAHASGFAFTAITDHSYDLACTMENYLLEDKTLQRWSSFKNQLSNQKFATTLLAGEEISCKNDSGAIIHLCGVGISDYIPGSMDGARKKIYHTTQLTIKEAVTRIHEQNGLAYAAHPGSQKSFLQTVFLNRGTWSENDILSNNLDGVQAFNGSFKEVWERGKKLWINALKRGQKLSLIAGNDAHGDFNRYRAIKTPFISILENFKRYMGFGKTGIYCSDSSSESLLSSIRDGKTFITTGPFLSLCYSESPADCAISKTPISAAVKDLYIHAISTAEFGPVRNIILFGYYKDSSCESTLFSKTYDDKAFQKCEPFNLKEIEGLVYIRASVISRKDDSATFEAHSSPCYL